MFSQLKTFIIAALILTITACSGVNNHTPNKNKTGSQGTLEKIRNRDKIMVGVRADFPPFNFIDRTGKNAGLEIDIAYNLAEKLLGTTDKVQFIPIYDASQRIELLNQGKVDLIIAAIKDTPELQEKIDLSQPYYASGIGFLTRKDSNITSWQNLNAKNVCLIRETSANNFLTEIGMNIEKFRSLAEVYVALQSGRCIGFVHDHAVIVKILQDPEWSNEWHQALPVLLKTPWVMGIQSGDALFKQVIDTAILQLEAEGVVVKSEQRWNITPTQYAQEKMRIARDRIAINPVSITSLTQQTISTLNLSNKRVIIDGSTAVFPVANQLAQKFMSQHPGLRIAVGNSGTEKGLESLCQGNLDIANASRPIQKIEIEQCDQNGIEYVEIPFAFDGIVVAINSNNNWVNCLTPQELGNIWEARTDQSIQNWKQIKKNYPNQSLVLYGDEVDSGTYDYFTEAVVENQERSRRDYIANRDGDLVAQSIASEKGSLGFLNFSAYVRNQDNIQAISIKNQKGRCVQPNQRSIADGRYVPLSRPLFFYVNKAALEENPAVKEFTKFWIKPTNSSEISAVGYVPLPSELLELVQKRLERMTTGSIFAGEPSVGVRLSDRL